MHLVSQLYPRFRALPHEILVCPALTLSAKLVQYKFHPKSFPISRNPNYSLHQGMTGLVAEKLVNAAAVIIGKIPSSGIRQTWEGIQTLQPTR